MIGKQFVRTVWSFELAIGWINGRWYLFIYLFILSKHGNVRINCQLTIIVIGLIIQYIAKYPHYWNRYFKTSDFWSIWLNFGSSTPSFQIRKEKRSCSIVYLFILVRLRVVSLTRIRTPISPWSVQLSISYIS